MSDWAPISINEIVAKLRNFAVATCVLLGASTASAQQSCIVEDLPTPGQSQQYDAMMRNLMMAHVPIEYRNSCGLRDETDQAFFDAIRRQTGCSDSAAYETFFGQFLTDQDQFIFAVSRTDLRTEESFATYCQIIERIDLSIAVTEDGGIDAEALQAQLPLFQALQSHVAEWRLP